MLIVAEHAPLQTCQNLKSQIGRSDIVDAECGDDVTVFQVSKALWAFACFQFLCNRLQFSGQKDASCSERDTENSPLVIGFLSDFDALRSTTI